MPHASKENLFFAALLSAASLWFVIWGMGYTYHHHTLIFLLATLFMVFMAFNIGGNDVANSFGTSVGAGTLSMKQALVVAGIFEVSGAMIAGGEVTDTIRKGIVDLGGIDVSPMEFVYIMMSALLAAAGWLLIATRKGWPVSTTHSIVGGIVGSSIALGIVIDGAETALSMVHWHKIGLIASSWVISPLLGGLLAYLLYGAIKTYILGYNERASERLRALKLEKKALRREYESQYMAMAPEARMAEDLKVVEDSEAEHEDDFSPAEIESIYYKKMYAHRKRKEEIKAYHALQNWVPLIAAFGSMIITGMVIFKGLKHIDLDFSTLNKYLIMFMIAALVWMAVFIYAKTIKGKNLEKSTFMLFSWLQVFTASGFAFSHGSNDIANAIGPFAAILDVLRTGSVAGQAAVPPLAMLTAGIAMVGGLWFVGRFVIQTVGHDLTNMHPASGFAAELSASAVILLATTFGIPVSSTHILIGAVLGVGMVNRQTNWALMKPIALAWIVTLPIAALLSALVFMVLRSLL
ncbi:inorganic phosphate transporter [Sulfurimonas sp. HSL-1656]|uniref:inorganic phosphate transporter n=1 Tax=Thiomicrolovo subterrani TaxID=3131934 RepID=UPI0031F95A1F